MRFEISYREEGAMFPTLECFETEEEAMERADEVGTDVITDLETGEEWLKCWFCEEWYPSYDIDKQGLCDRCKLALWSRGEEI